MTPQEWAGIIMCIAIPGAAVWAIVYGPVGLQRRLRGTAVMFRRPKANRGRTKKRRLAMAAEVEPFVMPAADESGVRARFDRESVDGLLTRIEHVAREVEALRVEAVRLQTKSGPQRRS